MQSDVRPVRTYRINEAVRDIISKNTLYQMLISTGLVNANALAREIKDSVEVITGKKVKINTVAKVITSVRPKEPVQSGTLNALDVALDTDVVETTVGFEEFSKMRPQLILLSFADGDKMRVLKRREGESASSDLVLVRLTFRGSSVAYHPLWIIFNSLGIEVKHVVRHDNRLFIFMARSDAVRALAAIDRLARPSKTGVPSAN